MPHTNTILFDIDNTLCTYRLTAEDILPQAFEAVDVEPFFDAEAYYERYDEFTDASDDLHGFRERCFATLAQEEGRDPEEGIAIARAYAEEREHTDVIVHNGAHQALSVLSGRYRMGVVTNGGRDVQEIKLSAAGLNEYFDIIVYAGHDIPAKPASEPFEVAVDALNTSPSRTLHVGDSLELDVAGAKRAGLQAGWVTSESDDRTTNVEPDYVFKSLGALCDEPWI